MGLTYEEFIFRIKLTEDSQLPVYKGSMFRGAFGWAFRDAVCLTKQKVCTNCIIRFDCSYFKIFETEISGHGINYLEGVRKVPHPFTILPPLEDTVKYRAGSELEIKIKLFGTAVNFIAYFVLSFQRMGEIGLSVRRHKYRLVSVYRYEPDGSRTDVFINNLFIKPVPAWKDLNINDQYSSDEERYLINFLTPATFQQNGKKIMKSSDVSSEIILLSLYRRLTGLVKLYGNGHPDEGLGLLQKNASFIEMNKLIYDDIKRFSNRQKTKMEFGGFRGSLIIRTSDPIAKKLLKAGTVLHAGKNSAFGYGYYSLIRLS